MDANAFPVLYASHDCEIMKSKSGHWNRRTTNRGGETLMPVHIELLISERNEGMYITDDVTLCG